MKSQQLKIKTNLKAGVSKVTVSGLSNNNYKTACPMACQSRGGWTNNYNTREDWCECAV